MFNFLNGKCWPIALDIGSGGVKVLQMRKLGDRVAIVACGRWRMPESVAQEPVERRKQIVSVVRDMLKHNGFQGRRAVSSLPCSSLNIKNVRLPHVGDKEMRQAAMAEAKERFPFEVDQDQLSLLNAGAIRQGEETRDEVILMASPREAIDEHLAMLHEMGLRPEHVDAEPVALFRSFERFLRRTVDEQAVSVIMDVGLASTRVVVARGRQIVFIKSIDIGGRRFSQAVARQLDLSPQEASDLRLRTMTDSRESASPAATSGSAPNSMNWTIHDALRGEVEALAREVALCLRYCSVTFRGLRADRVSITGGEAHDPMVVRLMSEHLNIPCTVASPLRGVELGAADLGSDRRGTLAEWAVSAGLAVRDVDMQPFMQRQEEAGLASAG